MKRVPTGAGVVFVLWVASACSVVSQPALRTNPNRAGSCSVGVGRDAIVHGAASDPRVAWAIDTMSGSRVELIWPARYSARFDPQLVVVDSTGKVVAREGDRIIGSCLSGSEDRDAIEVDPAEIRGPDWQPGDG